MPALKNLICAGLERHESRSGVRSGGISGAHNSNYVLTENFWNFFRVQLQAGVGRSVATPAEVVELFRAVAVALPLANPASCVTNVITQPDAP